MNSAFDGAQAQPANASSRRGSGASRPLSPTVRPPTAASGQSSNPSANERRTYDGASDNRLKSYSLSSGNTLQSSSSNARAEDREKQRLVRTLPTWVQSYDEEDEVDEAADPTSHLLPPLPLSAQLAQHNHTPTIKHKSEPGRLYDSQRERTPVTISSPVAVDASRWQSFVKASAYPPTSAEGGQQVDEDWLQNNLPDLSRPWLTGAKEGDAEAESNLFTSKAKRKRWWKRSQVCLLVLLWQPDSLSLIMAAYGIFRI
ncbi:MAG: hypothetical protein M1819_006406 [Sarea resinae]|nr:MAG: hypothetical protein M1819_006406 [Sarea resinae]